MLYIFRFRLFTGIIASDSYRFDFSQALLFLIAIALSLQVRVITSLCYRIEQNTQGLMFLGK
jgi:hypothetical protein